MNAEGFDADALWPPALLPDALVEGVFVPPAPLVRGTEAGEVIILVDVDTFSGSS